MGSAKMSDHVDHPVQPVEIIDGIGRFKANKIVRWLLDTHPHADMNMIAVTPFSQEDRDQFAQLIGYSVGGYSELGYHDPCKAVEAQRQIEVLIK